MKKVVVAVIFLVMLNTIAFAGVEIPEYIKVKLKDGSVIEVELETYLYSVVQSEMGIKYQTSDMDVDEYEAVPLEALKAQAVASRSYAVYNILELGEDADYHVESTTTSQVYTQNANINARVKKAVDKTAGQVITYDDEVACGYFFSTSGGHTESSENVWFAALPYVKGVEDKYEIEVNNKTTWVTSYSFDDIEQLVPSIGKFKSIKIVERSENDRVIELKIKGTKSSVTLSKSGIRSTLGTSKLRSQWFDVEVDEDNETITFSGRGFGHGVGMSQNGAIGMALEGFDYDEILEWYYTDIEIYGASTKKDDDEKYPEQYIEIEENEKERPLLQKLINVCSTNWILEIV